MKRRGFTLIELLVVIAIISVLASLLMPAIANSMRAARAVVSASNKKQLHTAFMYYADDHNNELPRTYSASLGGEWIATVGKYLNYEYADLIATDRRPVGAFACPNSQALTSTSGRSDFGLNRFIGDPPGAQSSGDPTPFNQSNIDEPSGTILLVDMKNCSRVAYPTWGIDPRQPNNSVQLLYVDGHVESQKTTGDPGPEFVDEAYQISLYNAAPWGWSSRPAGN